MSHIELPQMASSAYASNTVDHAGMYQLMVRREQAHPEWAAAISAPFQPPFALPQTYKEIAQVAATQRRLVQIFIADPDENVPLSQCLLYSGEQKLTDLTDQELFFEVDVKARLDTHNARRTKLTNKAVKERTEHLEPARVRDLKMTVVTIATF
jgi:hypothetical protein